MNFVSIEDCKAFVFPFIHERFTASEPAPIYEQFEPGMGDLEKVLGLVTNNTYYPDFARKCSYLLCSVAGQQYFPNGNKRLGVTILMQFLGINDANILMLEQTEYKELLATYFPIHEWEENKNIAHGHPLFLYNLAIVIGNPSAWGSQHDFDELKQSVAEIFTGLYQLSAPGQ